MSSPSSTLFLFSLLTIILSIAVQTYSQYDANTPFVTDCHGDNFTLSSPFDSNLRLLVDGLIASTPNSPTFFSLYNTSTSPQIFGLAQCRPDITPAVCTACLNQSAMDFFNHQGCGLKKFFANRAAKCLIRYSDQMFYGQPDERLFVWIPNNGQNMSASFNRRVNILMKSVMASAAASAFKFAVGVSNDSVDEPNIYGMGWCSMDLASSDCDQCLVSLSESIPAGKNFGNGAHVSCYWRFETYQFYSNSMLSPPPTETGGNSSNTVKLVLFIALPIAFALTLLCVFFILQLRKKRALKRLPTGHLVPKENMRSAESLLFDLDTIRKATDNFSEENKLGEGGFGPVYKGLLEDGQHIAVKRLSRTSTQGFVEMKNEVALVAKLQHKNLVRLLGCCLEENEMMLVYEYLPKTSLEKYLFDPTERPKLGWGTRYKIIEGIGRGLLYLHEDSRLKIIHRDLKASNILLDNNMTPKISDFGLARLFSIDQTQQNTSRIAGTFGYMAPEYAMHGLFSAKSDVFSYGVLILEIITGRRNGVFTDIGDPLDLLSYVWMYWNQMMPLQVVDECLGHEYQSQEVLRCLHIGLLCVQDDSLLRPSMDSVMLMISSHSTTLTAPSKPPFYFGGNSHGESEQDASKNEQSNEVSADSVTMTDLEAR